jgi:hypothetical protein
MAPCYIKRCVDPCIWMLAAFGLIAPRPLGLALEAVMLGRFVTGYRASRLANDNIQTVRAGHGRRLASLGTLKHLAAARSNLTTETIVR